MCREHKTAPSGNRLGDFSQQRDAPLHEVSNAVQFVIPYEGHAHDLASPAVCTIVSDSLHRRERRPLSAMMRLCYGERCLSSCGSPALRLLEIFARQVTCTMLRDLHPHDRDSYITFVSETHVYYIKGVASMGTTARSRIMPPNAHAVYPCSGSAGVESTTHIGGPQMSEEWN